MGGVIKKGKNECKHDSRGRATRVGETTTEVERMCKSDPEERVNCGMLAKKMQK